MADAHLLDLPQEVLEHVMRFLDPMSLYATALQCRALNTLRWPVMDLRHIPMQKLTPEVMEYIVGARRPEVLKLAGVLGCPRSAMTPESVATLARARTLRHLDLEATYMGDESIAHLANVLTFLHFLNLRFNGITSRGAATLGAALPGALQLHTLNLSGNQLCSGEDETEAGGFDTLCQGLARVESLRVLVLRNVSLAESHATSVGKLLRAHPHLHQLDLSINPLGDAGVEAVAKGLAACTSLRGLALSNVQLNDQGMFALAEAIASWPNRSLRAIDLSDNPVGANLDHLGKALAHQQTLRRVCLAGCNLHDLSPASASLLLAQCGHAVVDLRRCRISDASCTNLAAVFADGQAPTAIELSSNACAQGSMQQLGRAMAHNTSTTSLKLNFNALGDSGARALCEGLMSNTTLRVLHVADTGFGGAGLRALASYLAQTHTLRDLDVSGNIVMRQRDACAEFGAALGRNPSLVSLTMRSMDLLGSDASALVSAWLTTSTAASSSSSSSPAYATSSSPSSSSSSSSSSASSGQGAPHHNTAATASGSSSSSSSSSSRSRRSRGNGGGSSSHATSTARAPASSSLLVAASSLSPPVSERPRQLQHLNLAGNELGAEGACAVARLLRADHTHLTTLVLSGNSIGDAGAAHLATGLASNTRLRQLQLRNNDITPDGARALADALQPVRSSCRLADLDLSRNHVSDEGTVHICGALRTNEHLKRLSLAHNCIGKRGAEALGALLGMSPALERLSIEDNKVDCDGVAALTLGLSSNLRLRELNMQNVGVDTEACALPRQRPDAGRRCGGRHVRVIGSRENHSLHQKAIEHLPAINGL